jgi:hypothetical protein
MLEIRVCGSTVGVVNGPGVSRDAVEQNFADCVLKLRAPTQDGSVGGTVTGPVRPGSALSGRQCLDLFDAQLASRHLDLAARWLRERNAGFYTIFSSGHEGNAAVAAALRPCCTTGPARSTWPGRPPPGRRGMAPGTSCSAWWPRPPSRSRAAGTR